MRRITKVVENALFRFFYKNANLFMLKLVYATSWLA